MINLTVVNYFIAGMVTYYCVLFLLSLARRTGPSGSSATPFVVIVIPACDEELVIERTVRSLMDLDYDEYLVVVVNDGSTDATGEVLDRLRTELAERLVVIERPPGSGGGKSGALNHGFDVVVRLLESNPSLAGGRSSDQVVVGVLDADGTFDRSALAVVAPYFSDPTVGSVQIGVRIANAHQNLLTRLQDAEFVGFSCLVQLARDRFGSAGLGGNGQFNRLSALLSLGGHPWSPTALTEDLDLGLRLVEAGWTTRFCARAFVAQQGLDAWRPLLRQRTRWIQGHYQCWRHFPALARRRGIRMATRIDLAIYLALVVTVMVVGFSLVVGIAGIFGLIPVTNGFLAFLAPGPGRRTVAVVFAIVPVTVFMIAYQRHALRPLRSYEVPAFALAFTIYTYVWVLATLRAWFRLATGRRTWIKTPRVDATEDLAWP